jgi:hypothetical protein
MTMTLPIATARLGRELKVAHESIDQAMVATAALLHSTAIARVDIHDADPALGHAAMLRMHKSLGELLGVRADMLRAHEALKSDLRVIAGPEEPTCPDYSTNPFTTATAA